MKDQILSYQKSAHEKVTILDKKRRPLVSVIVPTLNEEKYIEKCLKAIRNQSYRNYELIISDGDSDDKTIEIAKKYADKIVISKKRGFAAQHNNGAKVSSGKILVFVRADNIVAEDLLEEAVRFVNNGYVCGGCKVIPDEPYKASYNIFYSIISFLNVITSKMKINIAFIGDVFFFDKKAFSKISGFKEVAGSEDVDIIIRIRNIGRIGWTGKTYTINSSRRFKKEGFFVTVMRWIIGCLWVLIKKPLKQRYKYGYHTHLKTVY